jgi:microcystin-dependent protein
MADPFLGEIRMFGGNYAPVGWAFCNGAIESISQNDALFALVGTTYGGDGVTTFGLPDLQSRIPVHAGQGPGISQNYQLGAKAGAESVVLTTPQLPIHTHAFFASTAGATQMSPTNQVIAQSGQRAVYTEDTTTTNLAPTAIGPAGEGQPHDNLQPYLCITFIIALAGIFPPQS